MKNKKIEELSKRTIELFERTKKHYKVYEDERQELYRYFDNPKEKNVEKWEKCIIKLEERLNEEINEKI